MSTTALDDDFEPLVAARQVRQRLESLRRAGLEFVPRPAEVEYEPLSWPAAGSTAEPEAEAPRRRPVEPAAEEADPPRAPAAPTPPRPRPSPPPATSPAPASPSIPMLVGSLFDEPGPDLGPFVPPDERARVLEVLNAEEVVSCTRCELLASTRTQTVFGEGSPTARLMFLGEAPGADEDRTGRPFVGRAGQLLDDMITKGMGLRREDVYIANVLKCRPPGNRDPQPDEVANCRGYLERQISIIRPEFLCFLGRISAQTMLETALPLGKLRGKWHRFRGIPAIVTYHPAYLLRNPEGKRDAWADLKMLMTAMGIAPPGRKKGSG